MRRILNILILILTFTSCETYEEQERSENLKIYSDHFKELRSEENFEIIKIDSFQNFKDLTSVMGEFSCQEKISGINFNYDKKEYFLTGFSECPTFNGVACYFRRNTIIIKNDSIVTDLYKKEKAPIEDLGIELEKIISKQQNFKYKQQILKPALIHLYIDENQNIKKTKKVLKEIVENFKKINSSQKTNFFEYNILFENFDRTNFPLPPPPPPIPVESSIENP